MPPENKKKKVEELTSLLSSSQSVILTDYRGLSVLEISKMRNNLREKGIDYHVVKNTLMTIAADQV